ncbi:hypothetical protein [Micromonospora carbonacea]|uniref:Uncharacterized protein n=1 Tax=Micromonospora carbonacea TaxID=47853 RepID=A0A1C5A3F2_9ACTN|nr:hypothetical protein [Micromonospora carbonacea]SCF39679.1 hypothetical protein GA0070563_11151 [Micromonospora carbonacea]
MTAREPTAQELREQLDAARAVLTVERDDLLKRKRLDAEHRDALAEVAELTTSRTRARRERDRDEEEAAALAELYRRATRSGARARIRTDIDRSAEMRALRIARVRAATLWVGMPVLVAFGAWSTAGVQAGVVTLLGLDSGSAGWWAAWAVEPALITVVAAIIVGRAVLRASGGDTDWRATVAEWTALSTSIGLNLADGWTGTGVAALGGALAHSVGPAGAGGTAWLIGLFVSYVSAARPWEGAPRLADLDLTPPPAAPAADRVARPEVDRPDDLEALVEVVAPTTAELVEQAVERHLAGLPAADPTPTIHRPRWQPAVAPRPRRLATPRAPEVTVVVAEPATPAATRPVRRWHSPTTVRSRHLRDTVTRRMSHGRGDTGSDTAHRRLSSPKPAAGDSDHDTVTRRVSRPKPPSGRQSTAERVAAAVAKNPAVKPDALAKKFGVSTRTIQRAWPKQTAVNGHDHSKGA